MCYTLFNVCCYYSKRYICQVLAPVISAERLEIKARTSSNLANQLSFDSEAANLTANE